MKTMIAAAATLAVGLVGAQSYDSSVYRVAPPIYYRYNYSTPPYLYPYPGQIINLGGNYAPSHRQANVPFAYGSFFYGQNIQQWMRAKRRGFRW